MKEDIRMKQQSLIEAVDFYNYNSYLKKNKLKSTAKSVNTFTCFTVIASIISDKKCFILNVRYVQFILSKVPHTCTFL